MFIASLFKIVKNGKQPKFPSAYEWINTMCHVDIMHTTACKSPENLSETI